MVPAKHEQFFETVSQEQALVLFHLINRNVEYFWDCYSSG